MKQARHTFVMAEEVMNEVPVMRELPAPRETHVLARGQYDAPTSDATRVTRATFKSIGPAFPKDAPLDRLGLARWTTLPENPFTSRVAVNRIWANFFGTGIFATHENLGLQGTSPTHPELLDRLAADFVKGGWNVKALCKDIALSATYRQDSKASPELSRPIPRIFSTPAAPRIASARSRSATWRSPGRDCSIPSAAGRRFRLISRAAISGASPIRCRPPTSSPSERRSIGVPFTPCGNAPRRCPTCWPLTPLARGLHGQAFAHEYAAAGARAAQR